VPAPTDPLQQLAEDDERLRHADRLAILGRLAAGVAHELGTPLSVIRLHAQLLASGEVADPTEVRQSAQGVVEQCDRMSGLLRRLLDFARAREAMPTPMELGPLARSTLDLVAPMARKLDVALTGPRPATPARVLGVRGELQQVLLNLVVNAMQAMPDGGSVAVSVEARGPRVHLVVADDGPGIPADDLPRIFEPFYTTKDEGVGTGLGLSVVREIVEGMGGTITVAATDAGTTFDVDLPGVV